MNVLADLFCLCLVLSISSSKPLAGLLDANDSELVGSNVNKVYAQAPFEDLQSAGTGDGHKGHHDDDDEGYYVSKSTKGDDGYKHFDSYHKKGGDKYGYEAHSAYGKSKGDKDGGSHFTSGKYHEVDGDEGGSHGEYHDGEGTEVHYGKLKRKENPKDHKGAATDGDYYYSHYESDGEGDGGESGHYEGGDEGHYEDDGGHYSEGSEEESPSSGYYEGESDSGSYYDGEGETRQRGVIHHGPSGATSYVVRHS